MRLHRGPTFKMPRATAHPDWAESPPCGAPGSLRLPTSVLLSTRAPNSVRRGAHTPEAPCPPEDADTLTSSPKCFRRRGWHPPRDGGARPAAGDKRGHGGRGCRGAREGLQPRGPACVHVPKRKEGPLSKKQEEHHAWEGVTAGPFQIFLGIWNVPSFGQH